MTDSQVAHPLLCDLSSRRLPAVALAAWFACGALGCGQGSQIDRKPVHGKIVGAEGRDGMVTFYPIDTTIGPAAIGSFENGAYRFTTDDGPVPGEYNVSIEFEESESSPPKARNGPGAGLISKSETGIGEARVQFEPEKITAASVPADGPFEIDLNPTESAPE